MASTHHQMTSSGHTHSCPHHSTQAKGKRSEFISHLIHPRSPTLSLFLYLGRADFVPVSQRPRHSPYTMLEVDKALQLILSMAHRKPTKEIAVDTSTYDTAAHCRLVALTHILHLFGPFRHSWICYCRGRTCLPSSPTFPCLNQRWICCDW